MLQFQSFLLCFRGRTALYGDVTEHADRRI